MQTLVPIEHVAYSECSTLSLLMTSLALDCARLPTTTLQAIDAQQTALHPFIFDYRRC